MATHYKRKRIKSKRSFVDRVALLLVEVFSRKKRRTVESAQERQNVVSNRRLSTYVDMKDSQTPREVLGEEEPIEAVSDQRRGNFRDESPVPVDLDLKQGDGQGQASRVVRQQEQQRQSRETFWQQEERVEKKTSQMDERRTLSRVPLSQGISVVWQTVWSWIGISVLVLATMGMWLWDKTTSGLVTLRHRYPGLFVERSVPGLSSFDLSFDNIARIKAISRFLDFVQGSWDNRHYSRTQIRRRLPTLAGNPSTMSQDSDNQDQARSVKPQKHFVWRWTTRLFFTGAVAVLLLGGIFFIWVATLEIPQNNIDERIVAQSTKIYDETGEVLLYDVFKDERRTIVPLDDISENMILAIMAIEDDKFYEHNGVRPLALARAVYEKLRDPSQRLRGGSTITQQVIKNALLTDDRKIERKIKEMVLAWRLERQKTKDEIMEIYLNEIPFGGPVYGVEQAALSLFDKHASDLTITESAYLAALPKAPTTYLNDRARFDGRALFIINRMKELGFISETEHQTAIAEEVVFVERVDRGIKAPHFVFYVQEQLEEQLIDSDGALSQNGYRVQTTLNWDLQQKLEDVVATHTQRISDNYNASNLALVVVENKTGKIRAMVGSKDYFAEDIDGKFNITTAFRQPGSTFKPFVYAHAFERGYTPDTIVWDTPTEFSQSCFPDGEPRQTGFEDRCYKPNNYDLRFRGPIKLRDALAQSLNIPAVKLLYLVGVGESMNLARDLGITSLTKAPSFYGLNLVLGGGEVRMIDMASAYSTFANNGERHAMAIWEEVTDREGVVLDEYSDYSEQVLSANVAAMVNDVLSDNDAKRPMFGTYSRLYYEDGRDVAVKTGTTNNYRDVWTAGYSSDVTVVVWAGNNDNTPMSSSPSSSIVGPFWRDAMDVALEYYGTEAFTPYAIEGYEDLKPVLRGNYEGGGIVYVDPETEEVIENPTEEELEAGIYEPRGSVTYHSILHYVNRADVRGPVPQNPSVDGLYEHFEYGVDIWTEEQGWADRVSSSTINELLDQIQEITGEGDVDDDSSESNAPFNFSIATPLDGKIVLGNDRTTIRINTVGDEKEIDTIYYYLNNTYLGSGGYRMTSLSERFEDIRGVQEENELKVVVEKTNGQRIEKTITVLVK